MVVCITDGDGGVVVVWGPHRGQRYWPAQVLQQVGVLAAPHNLSQ